MNDNSQETEKDDLAADPKNGVVKRLLDGLADYWPVSIVMAAFTLLTNIELVHRFSRYLSTALDYWRDLLHAIFEFPINVILNFFDFPLIDIPHPLPEIATVISLVLLAARKGDSLEYHCQENKILKYTHPINIHNMISRAKPNFQDASILLITFILTILSTYVIFEIFNISLSWLVYVGAFLFFLLFISAISERIFRFTSHVFISFVLVFPLIFLVAIAIGSSVSAFELFANGIYDFVREVDIGEGS